ncbi:polypeptide deformylase [Legionella lansingensis]|uniref:Peptide deformylase n=1 Tax=Legionella lansingensis TaxID=45067 RepID=A0A0W0VQL7_9GAMM|nr:peptide deformylase [Legionella lansingensis]KTD22221.1 polypeptide deformylase [Legionella lansingensis]SNV55113.1 polypeptide deformylase [Legionella lansingensis]
MPSTYALEIVTLEDNKHKQILTTPTKTVAFPLSAEDLALIENMKKKLFELGGVGLAAPQVNHNKQIIAVFIPEEAALLRNNVHPYPMHILINPSYESVESTSKVADYEACYSVSSKAGKVPRYQQIVLNFYDEHGKKHQTIESGFYARVLQHEIDHLKGILITDRLTSDCVQGSVEEMMAMRRNELTESQRAVFDEVVKKKLKK